MYLTLLEGKKEFVNKSADKDYISDNKKSKLVMMTSNMVDKFEKLIEFIKNFLRNVQLNVQNKIINGFIKKKEKQLEYTKDPSTKTMVEQNLATMREKVNELPKLFKELEIKRAQLVKLKDTLRRAGYRATSDSGVVTNMTLRKLGVTDADPSLLDLPLTATVANARESIKDIVNLINEKIGEIKKVSVQINKNFKEGGK